MNTTDIQQGERLSFFKLFSEKNYRVCIPIIQRDYAQGRQTSKEVRDSFLTALYDYLDEGKSNRDLDFVYGTIMDNDGVKEFVPLDGQQRLTTLFLLHWYLSLVTTDTGAKELFFSKLLRGGKSMFTYRTRSSSTEFCDALMNNPVDLSALKPSDIDKKTGEDLHNALSKTIMNNAWFYLSWRHDPTVQSMLTMLDSIHQKFAGKEEFFPLLLNEKDPVITFLFLDLQIFKLTDDLYIKMNSRGKPLTPFENFKAKYEQSLETVDLGKREFFLTLQGKTEKVSLKRYFSHNIDTKWADLLWNYRGLQNRDGAKNDFTFDDELMNLIRVVFTNIYAIRNSIQPKIKDPAFEYLRGSDIAKKDNLDYSDSISYHKYKEFGLAFDKDDQDRLDKKPGDRTMSSQLKGTAYDYALALVDTLDCYWNGNLPIRTYLSKEYSFYFDEESNFKQALKHEFGKSQDRVCFHAYTRFLIYHKGNTDGMDEWMRVISNLSHPENTILDEASEIAAALKCVEKLLPYSKDILGYLKTDPTIEKFSSWQVLEEKIKAHLILRSERWKKAVESVEKHGYFNGQIGFLLDFSGIYEYYEYQNRHNCDWSQEEDDDYYAAFVNYSAKASGIFLKDYDSRVNDKEYVFERAVFTKGNYMATSTAWRRNLLSTNVVKNNVKRDHSWKRFLRLGDWPQIQEYVKEVMDDSRFDKDDIHGSLLEICKDRTGTWRDFFIEEPGIFDYCGQGFLHYKNDEGIVLLSQSQYNHYHAELYTYYLWLSVIKKNSQDFQRFGKIEYSDKKTSDDIPCIRFYDYVHNRIKYEMDVYFEAEDNGVPGKYELFFYKSSQMNAQEGDYGEDIADLLAAEGFCWFEDRDAFCWSCDGQNALLEKIHSFHDKLPV